MIRNSYCPSPATETTAFFIRALAAAPTSFPLSSSKAVKVEYGGAASDYAGDLLLLPFWSDKDIDVGAATIAQGWDAAFGGALTELAES